MSDTERLSPKHRRLILLVGSALFINHYDTGIFGQAIPQIQASFNIPENQIGFYTGILRFGVLLSFPIAAMADIIGRRRLLIWTLIGVSLCLVASAFTTTAPQFFALQIAARCLMYVEDMLCFVILAEEIEERTRGRALGYLASLGALGFVFSSLLYSQVNNMPHGWRDFYLISGLALVILIFARRNLQETQRFLDSKEAKRQIKQSFRTRLAPIISMFRDYPGRLVAVICTALPFNIAVIPTLGLLSKFLQSERGFTPMHVTAIFLTSGIVSIAGYFLAGPLSDKLGRKTILIGAIVAITPALALVLTLENFYLIAACFIFAQFCFYAADVTFAALGSELFPTSYRSTASGARAVVVIFGGMVGLMAESWVYSIAGSHGRALLWLVLLAPIAILPVLFFLPETANRKLEEIAPEIERDGHGPFP
jgi:MFS family permease